MDLDARRSEGRRLLSAVRREDLDEVLKFLADTPDLFYADDLGRTSLHWACFQGNFRLVELLLQHGSPTGTVDDAGDSLLHTAVACPSFEITQYLLLNGFDIDVNKPNKAGQSPLSFAVRAGSLAKVKLLCENGAQLSQQAGEVLCSTYLHELVDMGDMEIADYLIQQKIDLNSQDENGRTALHLAVSLKNHDFTSLLLASGANSAIEDHDGLSPLDIAVASGSLGLTRLLLEHRNDAEGQSGEEKGTALHLAAAIGNVEIMELLVENGANVNQRNYYGRVPLHYAAMHGHRLALEYLLVKGAERNHADAFGVTPMYWLSGRKHTEIDVYLALELGYLDLKAKDDSTIPFERIRTLGRGGQGIVDEVRYKHMRGVSFARKTMHLLPHADVEAAWVEFQNEVKIMRRLSAHRHIISCLATYATESPKEFAMILYPVADSGSLDEYMGNIRRSGELNENDGNILRHSFGCLANALAFTNEKVIRHKDVKPQNVLVHQGKMLLTDYGVAIDCSMSGLTTTTGELYKFSWRYIAPEMRTDLFNTDLNKQRRGRNRKTDVFSLACCFLEILVTWDKQVLPLDPWAPTAGGHAIDTSGLELPSAGTQLATRYCDVSDQILSFISRQMATATERPLKQAVLTIFKALTLMLKPDPADRCSAQTVVRVLAEDDSLFCEYCRSDLSKVLKGQ